MKTKLNHLDNIDLKLSNSQESKLRAMNLLNSYSFTWGELRALFKFVEIEKKLNRLNEIECNRELTQREITKQNNLFLLADNILTELNRGRKDSGFKLVFNGDPRGLALKLIPLDDERESNNILYNLYNY